VRKSLYDEIRQSSNVDLCHLTTCIYYPDILAV